MQRFDMRWRRATTTHAGSDRSIVNPQRLPGARANDICGACHAGRTLPDVAALDRWMSKGPSYRPGDDLSQHLLTLQATTPSPSAHMPDLFRNRFWHDGSIRLSAYEYQGLKSSACAVDEELTCIRCHSMHGGDPAGCCRRPTVAMRHVCAAIRTSRTGSLSTAVTLPNRSAPAA
ncbi:MAG: hypothetical protein IPO66_22875, partial [Rhodanobacteraceae bacterium]|nr:hypothetical protein [Rhodanobacteraceae bacterium]